MILEIVLIVTFMATILLGTIIIYKQIALVKKGIIKKIDLIQCVFYGFIFGVSTLIVIVMAVFFTINNADFWKDSTIGPPTLNPLFLLIPLIICLIYLTIYPLIDFLFIALSEKTHEGLTPFHKAIGRNVINRKNSKKTTSLLRAVTFYLLYILPLLLSLLFNFHVIIVWITSVLVYPLMILTFYGSKGYIAGISDVYYHIPAIDRSIFLNFEDNKRAFKEFSSNPGPFILLGVMIFVFVWAWISLFQTIMFFFTGIIFISTMASFFVFVTLAMGVIGYFTRFWGRKITFRAIDIYFAAYLMASIGVNVLVNFIVVNANMLTNTFQVWLLTAEIISYYRVFAWAAVIEEFILIIFTSYYLFFKESDFIKNLKISKINECGQNFDSVPLFTLIRNKDEEIRNKAKSTLIMMFERIPLKPELDINDWKFKNMLIDGICDSNSNVSEICFHIFLNLEIDYPNIVLSWIKSILESPNYDKKIPILKSLIISNYTLANEIPNKIILSLTRDPDWIVRKLSIQLLNMMNRLSKTYTIGDLSLANLIEDPDYEVQKNTLDLSARYSFNLRVSDALKKLESKNHKVRSAGLLNIKNMKNVEEFPELISRILEFTKDPSSYVRASAFELLSSIGNFQKYYIPIAPFIDALIDDNNDVRRASILAMEKYFEENPESINIDEIIKKIDPTNVEVLRSIIEFLGRLWKRNPEKILTTLLIFIKFDNESLKNQISNLLINKYPLNKDLIFDNLIMLPDVSKFVTKGIVSKTLIGLTRTDPDFIIPKLLNQLNSNNDDVLINALNTLDGVIDEYTDKIEFDRLLSTFQSTTNNQAKKLLSKTINKIVKSKEGIQKLNVGTLIKLFKGQESSVRITLSKILLDLAKDTPEKIPVTLSIDMLNEEDSIIKESGAKILGLIGKNEPEKAFEILSKQGLKHDNWSVRESSVSSLGRIAEYIENKEKVINEIKDMLKDTNPWVRRSAINIISSIEGVTASKIPFEIITDNVKHKESTVREASVKLLKVYGLVNIERIFDMILLLLEDSSEDVRKAMINTTVDLIGEVKLTKILPNLLKNLSDERSLTLQRSIAITLSRTVKYENEKVKKRVIALLKIRCEMSQDPVICDIFNQLKEN